MTDQQIQIIADTKIIVTDIFEQKVNPLFVFHNLEHTRQVADAAEAIANFYQFNEDDKFILLVAAWFHDTGFSAGRIEGHELESIKIAENFLQTHNIENDIIQRVSSCVKATKMPQRPQNGLEKIICDADLFHLGTIQFNRRTDLLRTELQAYYNREISYEEWQLGNIEFLISHNYFTGYCQQKLEPVKQIWLNRLQNKQQRFKAKAI